MRWHASERTTITAFRVGGGAGGLGRSWDAGHGGDTGSRHKRKETLTHPTWGGGSGPYCEQAEAGWRRCRDCARGFRSGGTWADVICVHRFGCCSRIHAGCIASGYIICIGAVPVTIAGSAASVARAANGIRDRCPKREAAASADIAAFGRASDRCRSRRGAASVPIPPPPDGRHFIPRRADSASPWLAGSG